MALLPFAVLLRSGGHEAAHYALVLTTAAAAIGRPTILFATNGGCHLLRKKTPLLQDARETLLAERGVATLAQLLEAAEELPELRLLACEAGLRAEALMPESLRPGVEVAGVVTLLSDTGTGQIISL